MPAGVPVGTLAIGRAGAINAALLAAVDPRHRRRRARRAHRAASRGPDCIGGRIARMTVAPGGTIGIIGGGQLGKMLAVAAAQLGYRCHVFDPDEAPCAADVAAQFTRGRLCRRRCAAPLCRQRRRRHLRVREHPGRLAAGASQRSCAPASPRCRSARTARPRKRSSSNAAAPSARGCASTATTTRAPPSSELGLPLVLKTRRMGYDGKGQAWAREPGSAVAAWEAIGRQPAVAEAAVDYACEFSVILARAAGRQGRHMGPAAQRA